MITLTCRGNYHINEISKKFISLAEEIKAFLGIGILKVIIIQDYWPTSFELNVTAAPNEMFEKILKVHQLGQKNMLI